MAHIFKILAALEFLSNRLFNYHLLYFCTALSLIIMLSSHYHLHNSKTLSQLTQCPFTGTLLLLTSGASVIGWTLGHPLIKSKAGFLMYLFQDRKLQPSTIDGYRSVIADKLVNSPINVNKMRISLIPWTVQIETDQKVGGASPPETSPWCCTIWQGSIRTP